MVADVPLLALPSGSILQFLLMTLPLLCVYLYFLYLAIDRVNIANPNDPRYTDDRIRLMDILYTYLATLVLFSSLVVYLLWFVNKRRKLSKRYEREAMSNTTKVTPPTTTRAAKRKYAVPIFGGGSPTVSHCGIITDASCTIWNGSRTIHHVITKSAREGI
mmetsp:Transcript_18895/g.40886  ORF Transcript_18895/g.40886 Transcript_18895/m.40886 type:complete len:161 (-) Transcript_18895:783-1265(-)